MNPCNDKTCCECSTGLGGETYPLSSPVGTTNPAAATALIYRLGTHGTFKESMILRAAGEPGLIRHTTRDAASPMNAFFDAAAYLLDILCFYNERILNEGYLPTATERLSLLELARSIGYELHPGVAAATRLAFDVQIAPGMPETVQVEPGIQVQTIPLPGEDPQIFETIESVEALPAWNSFQPKQTRPQYWTTGKQDVTIDGVGLNLPLGSRLLLLYAPLEDDSWETMEIASVEEDYERKVTRYGFSQPLTVPSGPLAEGYPKVYKFSSEARVFGSNAPDWRTLPFDSKRAVLGLAEGAPIPYDNSFEWPNFVIHLPNDFSSRFDSFHTIATAALEHVEETSEATLMFMVSPGTGSLLFDPSLPQIQLFNEYKASTLSLDQEYKDTLTGSLVYLDDPAGKAVLEVIGVETISRSAFALSGKSTIVTADATKLEPFRDSVRSLTVLVGSRELALAEESDPSVVTGASVRLPSSLPELPLGRILSLEGVDADTGENAHLELTVKTLAPSGSEDAWDVTFEETIAENIERATALFRGNLAQASHGRSVVETPGHGDGRKRWLEVSLAQNPLTYVSSAKSPKGIASTLTVSIDGIDWAEADFFYGTGPEDEIHTVRHEDDGTPKIRFGDGVTGRRVPTGINNIKASYRTGLGESGNLEPGRLTNLMTRPLGLQNVYQPLIATGGEDPESRDNARTNAPLTMKTLDRLVSLSDYGDFARTYGGIAKAHSVWGRFGQNQGILLTIAGVNGAEVPDESELGRNFRASLERYRDPAVPFEVVNYQPRSFAVNAVLHTDERFDAENILGEATRFFETRYSFDSMQLGESVNSSDIISLLQSVAGVLGVDLDYLHFTENAATRETRLPARRGRTNFSGTIFPAELLTLDPAALSLTAVEETTN